MSDKTENTTDDRMTRLLRQSALEIQRLRDELRKAEAAAVEPIAIIGVGMRLPGGAVNLEGLWNVLTAEHDAVGSVPDNRFGKRSVSDAGFINAMDFDAEFFRIGPQEALALDPQHRLLLESAWIALESAGVVPGSLVESTTGIFVGFIPSGYGWDADPNVFTMTGQSSAFAAARIAFILGLQGPTFVVDTACSSGIVALHLATRALRYGECKLALAAGVNVLATSESFDFYARAGMTATDGRTRTFSSKAAGFGRGEGVVTLALTTLTIAEAQGYPILGIVRGSAVNHCGAGSSLTAPNGTSQRKVLRTALADARIEPADVSYIECHGTGTKLGDAIEVQALGDVYAQRGEAAPLLLGTIKTRIGHIEAASGLAGVAAVLAAMRHETLPASLNTTPRNTDIDWDRLPIEVIDTARPWGTNGKPRRAAVSAFSLSGTNAHLIIEEPPVRTAPASNTQAASMLALPLLISAKNEPALRAQAGQLVQWLSTHPMVPVVDVLATLAKRRTHFTERFALVVPAGSDGFPADVVRTLESFAKFGQTGVTDTKDSSSSALSTDDVAALVAAWAAGASVDWTPLFPPGAKIVQNLPTYPFQRAPYWLEERAHESIAIAPEAPDTVISVDNPSWSREETELVRIWRAIFGIPNLGLLDNFLTLGGSSLVATEVVRQAAQVGLTFQPRDLLRYPTISELAATLRSEGAELRDSCLLPLRRSGGEQPLIFAPPLEGNVWYLRELKDALRESLPVWVFDQSVLARRGSMPDSLGALASVYVDDLLATFPRLSSYRIAGYSFGCSVAVEIARQLVERGYAVSHVLLLDGPPKGIARTAMPHHLILWAFMQSLRLTTHTREAIFVMEVDAILDLLRGVLAERALPLNASDPLEFMGDLLAISEHNMKLFDEWEAKPYRGSITLFRNATHYFDSPELGWPKFILGKVDIIPVPGDHLTMVLEPFASTLAVCIERQLDASGKSRSAQSIARSPKSPPPTTGIA